MTEIRSQISESGKTGRTAISIKNILLALCSLLLAPCSAVDAQQTGKYFRIGFLDSGTASGSAGVLEVFRQEMRKLRWIEAKNISIDYRFAEGKPDRLANLAADLVRLKVDLIVVTSGPPALAAKGATTTIPIVMTSTTNPVGEGLVASLARPGGNVTGLSGLANELTPKGWSYSRTPSPDSHELGFCRRRKVSNGKRSGLRPWP
jgi:ABC-type uncharacterized transport system substrate-binding protein